MVARDERALAVAALDDSVDENRLRPELALLEELDAPELLELFGRRLRDDQLARAAHHEQSVARRQHRAIADAALTPGGLAVQVDALQHLTVEAVHVRADLH